MTEVRFYHLERQPLDKVLPGMVQRGLERGWRAVVQASSEERVESLSGLLWTFQDDAFLPHGSKADGMAHLQPVWLTAADENPNGATVRFYVDGAKPGDIAGLTRAVVIFDGNDEAAVALAREDWKRFRAEGCEVSYWQQDGEGRWLDRAQRPISEGG
ncbi:MAG: DNA polymerase III subunit chi [Rhizobiales bacterium]|nr:DNA polymerase III subunit chi [Hyphomicrobiales bacterium]